jgi:hypothetical protein
MGLLVRPAPADAGDDAENRVEGRHNSSTCSTGPERREDDRGCRPRLDAEGKPFAGAGLAVTARQGVLLSSWEGWATLRNEVLAQARSDADGRFRLVVPRTDPNMTVRHIRVVATAAGHGLGWKAIDPNAEKSEADIRLTAVQPVRGRLVGIQGEAAAGVTVHVVRITRKPGKGESEGDAALRPPESLKLHAATDDKGEFTFPGFGTDLKLELRSVIPVMTQGRVDRQHGRQADGENLPGAARAGWPRASSTRTPVNPCHSLG